MAPARCLALRLSGWFKYLKNVLLNTISIEFVQICERICIGFHNYARLIECPCADGGFR